MNEICCCIPCYYDIYSGIEIRLSMDKPEESFKGKGQLPARERCDLEMR